MAKGAKLWRIFAWCFQNIHPNLSVHKKLNSPKWPIFWEISTKRSYAYTFLTPLCPQSLKIICYIDIHFPLKKRYKYTDAMNCKSGLQKFNELNASHCSLRFSTKLFHPPKVKTASFLKSFFRENLKPPGGRIIGRVKLNPL